MENKESNMQLVSVDQDNDGNDDEALPPEISVSHFDSSVENHLKAMDKMLELSGESEFVYDQSEIQRMSSSVTFLREWRHFCYQPQDIRFACQSETPQRKNVTSRIVNLTQFSSAAVPKENSVGDKVSSDSSKDFVMYVGGLVWALDWCPRVHEKPDCDFNLEFIAVAAHPPESSYHKIGAPLTGRGVIQIWGLLNRGLKDQDLISNAKKKRKYNTSSNKEKNPKSTEPTKPRGRPRKHPIKEPVKLPQDSTTLLLTNGNSVNTLQLVDTEETDTNIKPEPPKKPRGRPRKNPVKDEKISNDKLENSNQVIKPLAIAFPEENANEKNQYLKPLAIKYHDDSSKLHKIVSKKGSKRKREAEDKSQHSEIPGSISSKSKLSKCNVGPALLSESDSCQIPEDVALPRLVMCLAHNGKVALDVKWRPCVVDSKHRMGYLAVLLGNGALEVWDVPVPRAVEVMYSACQKEGTDPRYMKLEPVFRCSALKCGNRKSIPLTLEWSKSSPHDLILAGCHDGVVALWKFSADGPLKDTRPLLCFSADTVPIRALAWAPVLSDPENANIIVTAGHKGVKFWDIRDPFRPLWDVNPVDKTIYGLDWHPDPRCVVVSYDHGELSLIGLSKAAYDVPVTGKPFIGTQYQGIHSYQCSSSSVWNVQVSRLTGMVAYCCSDGKVSHFQLTTKAVEKDPRRNGEPHYLCGALSMEESGLTVLSPTKDSSNESIGNIPRSRRGSISVSNQEKRAKEQTPKFQKPEDHQSPPLALCYNGNDPGSDCESEKSQQSSKKEGREDTEGEVWPPKMNAMYRVRWNINKGGGRWLCYGGAAGILRCQEITPIL